MNQFRLDPNLHLIDVLPWLLDGTGRGFDLVVVFSLLGVIVSGKRTFPGSTMHLGVGYSSPIKLSPDRCPPLKRNAWGPLVPRMGESTHRHCGLGFPNVTLVSIGVHPSIDSAPQRVIDLDLCRIPTGLPFWDGAHKFELLSIPLW